MSIFTDNIKTFSDSIGDHTHPDVIKKMFDMAVLEIERLESVIEKNADWRKKAGLTYKPKGINQ